MKRIVILISGRGSNMEAMLRAGLPATIAAVISNDPAALGLKTAAAQGIATAAVDHKRFASRADFDAELQKVVDSHAPDLVVLAGFMRVLTQPFVDHYRGRMMNIHPSLLPCFPGLHTHRQALAAGVKLHGCSVHFVTPALDHGPIVAQAAVPVLPGDTEDTLAGRVLREEQRIYPQSVRWFCEDRIAILDDGTVRVTTPNAATGSLLSPALG